MPDLSALASFFQFFGFPRSPPRLFSFLHIHHPLFSFPLYPFFPFYFRIDMSERSTILSSSPSRFRPPIITCRKLSRRFLYAYGMPAPQSPFPRHPFTAFSFFLPDVGSVSHYFPKFSSQTQKKSFFTKISTFRHIHPFCCYYFLPIRKIPLILPLHSRKRTFLFLTLRDNPSPPPPLVKTGENSEPLGPSLLRICCLIPPALLSLGP